MSYEDRRSFETKKSNKIYVSNLSYLTTEEELNKMFSGFGKIVEVSLKRKQAITFAFIEFDSSEEAEAAVQSMNKKSIGDLELKVQFARGERKPFNRDGGYGGRGGDRGDRGGYRGGYNRDGPPRRDFGGDRPRGCFNCGKEGHMIRECPEPKKPREFNSDRGGFGGSYGGDRVERGGYRGGRGGYDRDRDNGRRRSPSDKSRSRSNDRKQKQRRRRSSSSRSK